MEKINKKLKIFLILIFIFGIVFINIFLFLLYGPFFKFRDWLINTAITTMNHRYLATFFYDDEVIEDSLDKNSITAFKFDSDLEKIEFVDYSQVENIEYENEFEKQVLDKSEENNDYKIIRITGEKYNGYLAVIYDPSRVDVVVTKHLGKDGQYLSTMSEQNEAYIAVTGGGFVDPGGHGTGGEPLGITIDDGKLIHETFYSKEVLKGGLVGLTSDNKLYLGDISSKQAITMGIRDSVSFGPYLIVNGVSADISGIAGGRSPRTAIGQRKDGIFLFLVLDGDRTLGNGATYQDTLDIMEKYGAYNASSLDGGTSTGMTVKNKLINTPITQSGKYRSRPISTAFILKSDDEDNGDYSVVSNKFE